MVWTVNKLALYGKLLMPEYSAITKHTSPFCLVASPTFVLLFHAAPDFMIHYNNWPCNPTMLNMSWIFKRRYYLGSHTKHRVGSPAFLLYWVHECGVVIQCRLLSLVYFRDVMSTREKDEWGSQGTEGHPKVSEREACFTLVHFIIVCNCLPKWPIWSAGWVIAQKLLC